MLAIIVMPTEQLCSNWRYEATWSRAVQFKPAIPLKFETNN
jgi:hypothetical protein